MVHDVEQLAVRIMFVSGKGPVTQVFACEPADGIIRVPSNQCASVICQPFQASEWIVPVPDREPLLIQHANPPSRGVVLVRQTTPARIKDTKQSVAEAI